MDFNLKLKEKHYKKSRFNAKSEQELAQFKKEHITQDLNEMQSIALSNLEAQSQILTKKKSEIHIPENGGLTSIVTQSQINAFTIILAFIEKYGKIEFLQIMSYTIDEKTIFALDELLKSGKITRLQILMTETASFRIPKIYKLLKDLFGSNPKTNLCFYWVHSKIHLIKCDGGNFVIDGSGNFSQNAQIEHYNIFNVQSLFDFHYQMADKFFLGEKLRKKHEVYKNFQL